MDTHAWLTVASIWGLCAVMAGIVASERRRRFWLWFPLGILTGPIGLYLALRAREVVPPELAQTCPHCGKTIRKTAHDCPYCKRPLAREPDRVMKASRQAAAAVFLLRRAAQRSTAAVKAEQAKRAQDRAARQGKKG